MNIIGCLNNFITSSRKWKTCTKYLLYFRFKLPYHFLPFTVLIKISKYFRNHRRSCVFVTSSHECGNTLAHNRNSFNRGPIVCKNGKEEGPDGGCVRHRESTASSRCLRAFLKCCDPRCLHRLCRDEKVERAKTVEKPEKPETRRTRTTYSLLRHQRAAPMRGWLSKEEKKGK